jgi:hypothetical protein
LPSNELQSISEFFNPTTSSSSSSILNTNKASEFYFTNKSPEKQENRKKDSPDSTEKSILVTSNETNLTTKNKCNKPKSIKSLKTKDNTLQINTSTISTGNQFNNSIEECELKNDNQTSQEKVIIQFYYFKHKN